MLTKNKKIIRTSVEQEILYSSALKAFDIRKLNLKKLIWEFFCECFNFFIPNCSIEMSESIRMNCLANIRKLHRFHGVVEVQTLGLCKDACWAAQLGIFLIGMYINAQRSTEIRTSPLCVVTFYFHEPAVN